MNASFNLTREPWIPCVPLKGNTVKELGIADALCNAHQLREIHHDSPLVTVSLYRLLLAVLYRACGPSSFADNERLWRDGKFPADALDRYLHRWKDHFDLFNEAHPFFQTAGLEMNKKDSLARLATELASGNNATLFDHTVDDQPPIYTPAEAARLLVAAQAFALGFGRSGAASIDGKKITPPYQSDAITLRGVTVWLTGGTLFHTLLLNLPYYAPSEDEDDDKPAWEYDAPYLLAYDNRGQARENTYAKGRVDRFTWQSRLIRLLPVEENERTVVRQMYFTQGRLPDKSPGDPMKAYHKSKDGWAPYSMKADKAAWRDAYALLAIGSDDTRPPEAFNYVAQLARKELASPELRYILHVTGLATDPGKAGKFLLWRHDRMPVPASLLQNADLVERLRTLTEDAENVANTLKDRARLMCRLFLEPDAETPAKQGKAGPKETDSLFETLDPRRAYWPRLEAPFSKLLLELPADPDQASQHWRETVQQEAQRAFRQSARVLGTSSRALRAIGTVSDFFAVSSSPAVTREEKTA